MLCVVILYKSGGTYNSKPTANIKFLRILSLLSDFCQKSVESPKKYLFLLGYGGYKIYECKCVRGSDTVKSFFYSLKRSIQMLFSTLNFLAQNIKSFGFPIFIPHTIAGDMLYMPHFKTFRSFKSTIFTRPHWNTDDSMDARFLASISKGFVLLSKEYL